MTGRHRKKPPPRSSSRVATFCGIGIILCGSGLAGAYGAIPYVASNSLVEPISAPTRQAGPSVERAALPPLVPGQEKDSGPPVDTTPLVPSPVRPSESDTGSSLTTSTSEAAPTTLPSQTILSQAQPQPLPADPVEEVEPQNASTNSAQPRIVEARPDPTCQPQGGIGLQLRAALATADIVSRFDFGGTLVGRGGRPRASDHPSGLATDFLTTDRNLGNSIRDYALSNKERLGVSYVIWRQRIYFESGSGRLMEDRGDATQNHFDHVHISFVSRPNSAFAPECD